MMNPDLAMVGVFASPQGSWAGVPTELICSQKRANKNNQSEGRKTRGRLHLLLMQAESVRFGGLTPPESMLFPPFGRKKNATRFIIRD
jgi:hypothetical protein